MTEQGGEGIGKALQGRGQKGEGLGQQGRAGLLLADFVRSLYLCSVSRRLDIRLRPGPPRPQCVSPWVLYHPLTDTLARHTLSSLSPGPSLLTPCCFQDHRPRPLPLGLSWPRLAAAAGESCVSQQSRMCTHEAQAAVHVYTCHLSWKIVPIIPGTTQM